MDAPPPCPFCAIASSYPPVSPTTTTHPFDPSATSPPAYPILSTPSVIAFLDIMPLARGHLLVAPRRHAEKMSDLSADEAASLGAWLPLLSRALCRSVNVRDWNVVQNNGELLPLPALPLHLQFFPPINPP
jgi:diadenosine tetraphosphate (Ap4A) HIT family hydrolase